MLSSGVRRSKNALPYAQCPILSPIHQLKGTIISFRAHSFSVFGWLQNSVLLARSSKTSRFRKPSRLSASWAGRLRRLCKDSRSDEILSDNLACEPCFQVGVYETFQTDWPIFGGMENVAWKAYWFQNSAVVFRNLKVPKEYVMRMNFTA